MTGQEGWSGGAGKAPKVPAVMRLRRRRRVLLAQQEEGQPLGGICNAMLQSSAEKMRTLRRDSDPTRRRAMGAMHSTSVSGTPGRTSLTSREERPSTRPGRVRDTSGTRPFLQIPSCGTRPGRVRGRLSQVAPITRSSRR
eukprot:gene13154-biopygen11047